MTISSAVPYGITPAYPLPGLKRKLKDIDFFTEVENQEAVRLLRSFFDRSLPYEIEPEFYQIYGISISSQDYLACKKAQILAINGQFGKYDLSNLGQLNISIDMEELRKRIPNFDLLRSIRWYIVTSFYLIEWQTPKELDHLREVEEIGHECIHLACAEGGHFEAAQFYLAIMPFSKDTQLRDKIVRLQPFLDNTSSGYLQEQLFALDAVKMADDDSFSGIETRKQFYDDKITRLRTILEKIKEHEYACTFLKEDLKLKIRTTALYLYCHAQVLGLGKDLKIEEYAQILLNESVYSRKPNGIHVQALKIVIRAFIILAKFDKINEAKLKLTSLIDRIKT